MEVWKIVAIVVFAAALVAVGYFLGTRGAADYIDIDRERARIREELEADFDQRVGEYRERLDRAKQAAAEASRRAERLAEALRGLSSQVRISAGDARGIAGGIGMAVSGNVDAAGAIESAAKRLRTIIDELEQVD